MTQQTSPLCVYPKKLENVYLQRYVHLCLRCSTIHGSHATETTKVSFDRWLDEDVVHVYKGILLSHKQDKILLFVTTWMGLENIMLSKISQSEKAKSHIISLIYEYKTQTARHRDQDGGYQRERGGLVKDQGSQIYGDRTWFDFGGGYKLQYIDVHWKPTQPY